MAKRVTFSDTDVEEKPPRRYTERRRSSAQTSALEKRKTRKIVILGSTKSGKTSLIKRFLDDTFEETYTPTVEESYNRDYEYLDHLLSLNIIDTCCPFTFPAMRDLHIKGADVAMLIYEIDNDKAIAVCLEMHKVIKQLRPYLPTILVGTKLDLHHRGNATGDEIQAKSQYSSLEEYEAVNKHFEPLNALNLKHVLASAKSGLRVTDAFHAGLDNVIIRIQSNSVSARRKLNKKIKHRLCCPIL